MRPSKLQAQFKTLRILKKANLGIYHPFLRKTLNELSRETNAGSFWVFEKKTRRSSRLYCSLSPTLGVAVSVRNCNDRSQHAEQYYCVISLLLF